jgi:hypothetical protein
MTRQPGLVIVAIAVLAGCGESATAPLDSAGPVDSADPCQAAFVMVESPRTTPPYSGTAYIDPDLITATDPTAFAGLTDTGQGVRTMFDRRTDSYNQVNAYLFLAAFGTTRTIEVQVDPEFTHAEAEIEAATYAAALGRMPGFLFADLHVMWIHKGRFPAGGGVDSLLIHTEQAVEYQRGGVLEEIFIHELSHTSMDRHHAATLRWLHAQTADGVAISTYARDNPDREDVAESVVVYLAQRFRAERLAPVDVTTIRDAIPRRIEYLDCLGLSMDLVP